jgi:hypothetical protein
MPKSFMDESLLGGEEARADPSAERGPGQRLAINSVEIGGVRRRALEVSGSEGTTQRSCRGGGYILRKGDADSTEVLGLEPEGSTAHLDAVGADEEVGHIGQQESAQDFEVPDVGGDVVEVVVRVEATFVEHGVGRSLDVGEQELGPLDEAMVDSVDRPVPGTRTLLGDVPSSESRTMAVQVIGQPRVVSQIHEALPVPRIDEVATRPGDHPTSDVGSLEQWKKAIGLNEI